MRRAYASYGPAYRLTYESGERIIASQPWNERFRHYPLPYLDEVRFAKNVAWVLTPGIPTDLPSPARSSTRCGALGGRWRRARGRGAPWSTMTSCRPSRPRSSPWPGAGAAGDADPATLRRARRRPRPSARLPAPRPLDAVTLVAALDGPRLLRSMDVAGERGRRARSRRWPSGGGATSRHDLRWVNGHPQYVLDHDLDRHSPGRTARGRDPHRARSRRAIPGARRGAAPSAPPGAPGLGRMARPRPRLGRAAARARQAAAARTARTGTRACCSPRATAHRRSVRLMVYTGIYHGGCRWPPPSCFATAAARP